MKKIKAWIQALRLYSLTASVGPVILVSSMAHFQQVNFRVVDLLFIFLGITSLHCATNLVNDYYDYKNSVDRPETLGSSRVLVDRLLSMNEVKVGFIVFYIVAAAVGIYFAALRGTPIILLFGAGIVGSYFYTAGKYAFKYIALGEVMVFTLMGPLMFLAINYSLVGKSSNIVLYVSVAIGLLIIAILTANNMRDIEDDKKSGIKTIATIIGYKKTKDIYWGELILPYLLIGWFVLRGFIPLPGLIVLLSVPLVAKQVLDSRKSLTASLVEDTAKLQFLFTILLSIGIFISKSI